MQNLTQSEEVLDRIEREEHHTWPRSIWNRKGTRALSIPAEIVATDSLENEQLIGLVITTEAKLFLTTERPTPLDNEAMAKLVGPCFIVSRKLKNIGKTLFFTIPKDIIGFGKIRHRDPILIRKRRKHFYQLMTSAEGWHQNG